MKGTRDKIVILRFFVEHKKIRLPTKFQIYLTPPSGFLPINPTFFSNIWRKYFSMDLFTVLHPSKLVLIILDINWAKTGALLLQISEISNSMDSSIVHWDQKNNHCTSKKWNWKENCCKNVNWQTLRQGQENQKTMTKVSWAKENILRLKENKLKR